MLPSASANTVLFDEFVCRSIVSRKAARFFALVREYDWVSALTGSSISRTATHLPSTSRTTGPWCVRYTVNSRWAMPVAVLYGTTMRFIVIARSSAP